MRSLLLLAALCCLVLSAYASPIKHADESEKEVSRQAAAAAPAPAATDDDDDDDDDDDEDDGEDIDDVLAADDDDDDDDDDEEAEEADDDEDDDYLERFFDDILGGEDDDDDDDEPSGVQPVVAPADTVAAAPAAPASAVAPLEEAAEASVEGEIAENEATPEGEEPEAGIREPASAEVEQPAAASAEVAAAPAEAEEDEEEEDDITDALDPEDEDDDDDDEEDDDDDDDDDDDISDALGRNVSAKHSRALSDEPEKKQAPVPAVYIGKYNKFIDNILEKMNDILRRSYDPVNVKLQPIDASKKKSKPKKNKTKSKKKTSNKKKTSARRTVPEIKSEQTGIPEKIDEKKSEDKVMNELKDIAEKNVSESRAIKDKTGSESGKAKSTTAKPTKPKPTKNTKPKPKPPAKTTTKKPVNKNKVKSGEKNKPRARGTLYGLSSLRRTGDVTVNIMSDQTTVKSNFQIGPLILRVEKEVGRGAKKELKSATATTAEMSGKITLRVNNDGVATLHSIKVLQPKQVRVDSNHERTRELVWQRSARIAHVVSEKLKSASKPMFQRQSVVKQ